MTKKYNVGVIGCGGFGKFCIDAYRQMSNVNVVAAADAIESNLIEVSRKFGVKKIFEDYQEVIKIAEIDIIFLATPPNLHYPMAMDSLRAGKHVIVEKPMALKTSVAREIIGYARSRRLHITVDYILRYNSIYDLLKKIINSKILGKITRLDLENFAQDEGLPRQSWFWDRERSGGIFIEHGVHFFDFYGSLVGEPQQVQAISLIREKTNQEDQVSCQVAYQNNILATYYHSFDRPARIEKCLWRITFEKGYVEICGWLPQEIKFEALAGFDDLEEWKRIFEEKNIKIAEEYLENKEVCYGRGKRYRINYLLKGCLKLKEPKLKLYKQCVQDLMSDFINVIKNHNHKGKFTAEETLSSLMVAETAVESISSGRTINITAEKKAGVY